MGRRGFGMVSARTEIYRMYGIQNRDLDRLRSWQCAAKRLAELGSARRYKAARETWQRGKNPSSRTPAA